MKFMKTPNQSLPVLLKKTQKTFNLFIRERDRDKGCISCGAKVTEAGHYYSQGHHSALRFSEENTHGQCTRCNCFLHGNLINYRHGLVKRITPDQLNLLDSIGTRNAVKKWTAFELEQLLTTFRNKIKELNK